MPNRTTAAGRAAAFLIALLLACGAAPARADEPPAEWIRLTVRPGGEAALEQFLAKLTDAARRTSAPVRWTVHRRVDSERPLYLLVLRAADDEQLAAWGSLTASEALERAYGAEEARRILALREQALEGVERERFVAQPALDLGD